MSSRRLSNETENTTPAAFVDKNDVFSDSVSNNAASKMSVTSEPLVESPKQGTPARSPPKKVLRTPELAPSQNPDKVIDEEEVKTKLTSADPTSQSAVESDDGSSKKSVDGANGTKEKEKPKPKAPKTKTSTISTTSRASSRPPKSPMVATAPKSPTREKAKAADRKASTREEATKKTAAAPKASVRKELSPGANVTRAKAKSPTRPAKLPTSLTTHTAASASKTGPGAAPARQTQSRAAGNASTLGVPAPVSQRPSSRASATGTSIPPPPKLRRQNSTINRARPSIGPPPKQQAKDHPPTKKEAHVDESFLARMMRPTQASSSKTTEKAPITPPRTRTGASSVKKSVTKDTEGNARRAGAKSVESSKTKGSPVEKKPKAAAKAEPTAKEVAPVVAQADTADTAIEAAAASKATAVTPVVEKSQAQASESVVNSVTAASEELQAQMTSGNAADKPEAGAAVSANPEEVKDVEDVVQKTSSLSLAQDESDPFVSAAPKTDEASTESMPAISTEDVQA